MSEAEAQATKPAEAQSEGTPPQAARAAEAPNLDAILHVPLEIGVELGRVELPLHVVARLKRGMVIEMNREANAEVTILANGAPFARGEVVAVGEKLGVRITEILPPAERLRALGG